MILMAVSIVSLAQTQTPAAAPAQPQVIPTQPSTSTPRVTTRQVRQQHRIANGVKSGELTPRETRHLEMREAKIQHDKKAAKADGTITPEERKKLRREENRTSRAIERQKHDNQATH